VPLVAEGTDGVPTGDPFETQFTKGQRNIFRQAYQKRADASLGKVLSIHEKYTLKYTLDVFNVTNTTSFDVPGDNVTQNAAYNNAPSVASGYTEIAPTPTECQSGTAPSGSFYSCPTGLGITKHTIGSPRQVQMSLHFNF
jgi:hypothetical protein